MSNLDWAKWSDVHESVDQQKRAKSALAKDLTPLEIDLEKSFGLFAGSEGCVYIATLFECQCVDFLVRNGAGPCKHMYRLAMELQLHPSDGMKSDQMASVAKLQRGELRKFYKTGRLEDVVVFHRYVDMVFDSAKGTKQKIPTCDITGNFCFLFTYSDSGLVKRNIAFLKDVGFLRDCLAIRLGDICLRKLDIEGILSLIES